jgi:hypothetical protein
MNDLSDMAFSQAYSQKKDARRKRRLPLGRRCPDQVFSVIAKVGLSAKNEASLPRVDSMFLSALAAAILADRPKH